MTRLERWSRPRPPRRAGSLAASIATMAVVLATVAPGSAGASPSSDTASSDDPPYVEAIQPELDQLISDLAITGAVLVRSPELGDWSTAIGTRTWHGTEPITLADHVRIGSNTKTWTGTVILQLVDEGRIGLDDPVSKYRPDVPNGDDITIAQLLDMSSGWPTTAPTSSSTSSRTTTRAGRGPRRNCSRWRSRSRLPSRRVRASCTRTPTTCCSG
jgi:D-alanyl-D-alanine carboxypeptidase